MPWNFHAISSMKTQGPTVVHPKKVTTTLPCSRAKMKSTTVIIRAQGANVSANLYDLVTLFELHDVNKVTKIKQCSRGPHTEWKWRQKKVNVRTALQFTYS